MNEDKQNLSTNKQSFSTNKKTVQRYMDAYEKLNHPQILDCLTDDVEWIIPGFIHRKGKADFDKEIENDQNDGGPEIKIARLTEENDVVIAEGAVKQKTKDGNTVSLAFCDVFEMENTKIKKLISYLVIQK